MFVKQERKSIIDKRGIIGTPDFVIEILLLNFKLDKETKFNLYERNSIPEYFIIDPETKEVWHYVIQNSTYSLQANLAAGQLNIKVIGLQINF